MGAGTLSAAVRLAPIEAMACSTGACGYAPTGCRGVVDDEPHSRRRIGACPADNSVFMRAGDVAEPHVGQRADKHIDYIE